MIAEANDAMKPGVASRKAFWARYAEIYPVSKDDQTGSGMSKWRIVADHDLVVSRWVGNENVGLFIRGLRGVNTQMVAVRLGSLGDELTLQLDAFLGNTTFHFAKENPITLSEPSTWETAIHWLETETLRYVNAISNVVPPEYLPLPSDVQIQPLES